MALPHDARTVTEAFLVEVDHGFPGRLRGLYLHGSLGWDEFFDGSDLDFVAVWDQLPRLTDLEVLASTHESIRERCPQRVFDGFHCVAADLAGDVTRVGTRPTFYEGRFEEYGTIDISPVTWHELSERPVIVRGQPPVVHTDLQQLLAHTRTNLDTYWRASIAQVDAGVIGADDSAVLWLGLGPARLHHLLTTGELTSKSGAGRYVRDELDDRWSLIARESLRLREQPGTPSLYDDLEDRGRDAQDLVRWLVEDGCRLR